jgi:hypothetical protein
MKVARFEKETWRWCRETERNIATGDEWKIKKVHVESPFRMLVINNAIPGNTNDENLEYLLRLKAMFDRGEKI